MAMSKTAIVQLTHDQIEYMAACVSGWNEDVCQDDRDLIDLEKLLSEAVAVTVTAAEDWESKPDPAYARDR
jgi:hypothetical protein